MTAPRANLLPESVQWGRWIEEQSAEAGRAVQREQGDAANSGLGFSSRADMLRDQINAVPSVAAIYSRAVPDFSVTRSGTATFHVYDSPTITFNPPRPDRDYQAQVIAVMRASGTLFTFSSSLLRVNQSDYMFQHENTQPAYTNSPTFSIMGGSSVGAGGSVAVNFGIASASTGTAEFSGCQVYCIFTGSIA